MDYFKLIDNLTERGYLKTPSIIEAFKAISRADFLPKDLKDRAGANMPLPIGFGQTNSQPLTVAFMLELLQPQPGDKILDIGAGSGWASALLAYCVGGRGNVCVVERIPELCEFGKNNMAKYNYIKKGVVEFFCADGTRGLPEQAPFDKIVAAAAAKEVPRAWQEQLKIGGRLVLPVANSLWLLVKKAKDKFEKEEFPGFAFVPLVIRH